MLCSQCEVNGHAPDTCGCGVCGSFGSCGYTCTAGADRVACDPKAPPGLPPLQPSPPSPPPLPPPCKAIVDLVLVFDLSYSVQSVRSSILDFAREIVSQFALGPSAAQIGIVEFSADAATLSEMSMDANALNTAISNASSAGGRTSISDGLARGLSVVTGATARHGSSMILLLTDGKQTVDGDDDTAIAQARVVKNAGVELVAIGFGGARVSTIEAIASPPASEYAYFGSDIDAIRRHFGQNASLCGLLLSPGA